MTFEETMRALEAAGTEQARKIYRRHGAPEPMFGTSFAVLEQLRRKIKADHGLARELWASGNTDARNLATMIADPHATTRAEIDRWVRDPNSGFFSGMLARHLIVKTPFAAEKALAWIKSGHAGMLQTGWLIISVGALKPEVFNDEDLLALLPGIEANIHGEENRVREAMNLALIGIGVRNARCRKAALAVARRIGKVEVDHGDTGCKTPDAAAYIMKTVAHHAAKTARTRRQGS